MKVFGKKTLALVLTIAMALSLCSFTAFAENEFTISGAQQIIGKGSKTTLTASGNPEGSKVTWKCEPKSVATIDENGNVTAVGKGDATITASYTPAESSTPVTAIHKITVEIPVDGVELNNDAVSQMYIGGTQQLTATVSPDDASNTGITWVTTDPSVADVSQTGYVTAKKVGTATIRAISAYDTTKKDEITITVSSDNVSSASLAAGESPTKSVTYGTSLTKVIDELKKVKITATYSQGGSLTVTADDWTSLNYSATTLGNYVFTSEAYKVSITVTVDKATVISSSVRPNTVTVTKGTALNALNLSASAALTLDNNYSLNISVGSGDSVDYEWVSNGYNANVTGPYTFKAQLKSGKTESRFDMTSDKAPTITVVVADYIPVEKTASETMTYSHTNNSVDLKSAIQSVVVEKIRERLGSGTYSATVDSVNLTSITTYGYVGTGNNKTVYYINKSLPSSGTATQNFTYVATGSDGQKYSGALVLTIYSGIFDVADKTSTSDPIVYFKGSNGIAQKIEDAFKARYGSTPTYIDFGSIGRNDDDLGELRDANADNAANGTYSFSSNDSEYPSVSEIYFIPTGKSGEFDVEYTAYSGSGSSQKTMTGTITITCEEMLVVWLNNLSAGETQNLSSSAIQDQVTEIVDTSRISYTLDTVILSKPSTGTLYDDSNKKITGTTKAIDADNLDDYTYEAPTKVTSNTLVTIKFSAKCQPDTGKNSKTVYGVMLFNLAQKADITVETGVKESVSFDLDMFEEFYQENISKNYKNYDIVAVSFSGVPNSKEKGYLRNDGKSIKSPNDKKFYIDSDKEGDYAFEDLTFEGGSKASTTRAEFTVYAKKDGKGTAKTVTGTIDFIVGSTHSLSGSIKASETMKFAASLSAFEDLGGNDNVYVTFTGLPNGGKLVYNWGTGSQEDVKVGTEYYLSYKAGKKLLSNVTFVPSYSSSKQARTISIPVKAYNSKEKAVTGTINITVNYAAYSSKFTDITTSTYADSVDFLYNQGITTGMTTTTFGPNSNVTRAQFVTFLYRAAGQPAVTGVTNKFTDVKSTGTYAYAYNAILWAVQNNITTGRSATKFDPAANVTHQELLTFLYRYDVNYLGHPGTQGSLSGFIDASSLQSYAVAPAKWAAYKGIIDGYTLQPAVAGSRATVALWLHRMLTL